MENISLFDLSDTDPPDYSATLSSSMLNESTNNTTSEHPPTTTVNPDDFSRPFYLNLVMFIFGALVVSINSGLLYQMHLRRGLLKAKRYAFLANLTFCDLFSGLIMIGLAIANVLGGDGPLVCLLQGETCVNLCLTMSSYSCSILVQFIAVRYPIYYKTNVTGPKVAMFVGLCWLYAIGFSAIKLSYVMAVTHHAPNAGTYSIFPYIDVAMKIMYLAGNCVCFGYVLVIAVIRRRQQQVALRGKSGSLTENARDDEETDRDTSQKVTERTPFRRISLAYIHHYEAILTSGIRLLVYIGTCSPLTVFCIYVLVTDNFDAMNPGKVYGDSRDVGVSLVLLWFCRAIIDPIITLIREKPMMPRRTSTTYSRRTTISSLHSRNPYERSESVFSKERRSIEPGESLV